MTAKPRKTPPLSVIVLAAGQGQRMKSVLPKVLQPLAGYPLIAHVIDAAKALNPELIHVVHGHGGELVRTAVRAPNLRWALQKEQLGTGHAVLQAMPGVPDGALVLVLYGDVPLIRAATLRELLKLAGPKSMGLLTAQLDDAAGYGRVVRDARGRVLRIVEQRDATARELKVREINTGVMAVDGRRLKGWLARLKTNNALREYYLTDIIAMAVKDRIKVIPLPAPTIAEVLGVNDKVQLAAVEAEYRRQRVHELMLAGVTVIDPARLDVRGAVSCGRDVVLDVNVVLDGPVQLGDGVYVGANCALSQVQVGAGTYIKPNCVIERAEIGARCRIGPPIISQRGCLARLQCWLSAVCSDFMTPTTPARAHRSYDPDPARSHSRSHHPPTTHATPKNAATRPHTIIPLFMDLFLCMAHHSSTAPTARSTAASSACRCRRYWKWR